MFEFLFIILIVVSISFFKAYKKTGSISGAIEHLKSMEGRAKKSVQENSPSVEKDFNDVEAEDYTVSTVTRDLTRDEISYLSFNIRFLSSLFIMGSLINLSVNLDRQIFIEPLNITIYTWYISLFFLLLSTITFIKPSTKKKSGKILLIEGKANTYTAKNIVHIGEYYIALPKSWFINDGDRVSIEGYANNGTNIIALNMGYNSIDGANIKKRGKWILLSIFLFINLFISGIVYEGGFAIYKLLAIHGVTTESLKESSYDSLVTKEFTTGQYVELKNMDSIVVNNLEESYRVLLPNSKGIDLDLSSVYYRLEKLKELQGTLMFNSLKYYYMDEMDFSFSNAFYTSDFELFLDNDEFLAALDQWEGYVNNELWVDVSEAEKKLDLFINSQVDILENELNSLIEESVYKNNYIKFYPTSHENTYDLEKSDFYIKYFDEPFKPEYNLDAYSFVKDLDDRFKESEKVDLKFFFKGYVDGKRATHINVDIIKNDRELELIYYRGGIFAISLLLYLLNVFISIRIKKSNNRKRDF